MYVITYQESGVPRRRTLPPGDTIAGRAPGCDLVIDDASVSRRHARFSVTDSACTVTDLESRNGTYVNGDIVSTARLADGDRLVLGRVPITVAYSAADRFSLSEHHTLIEEPGTIYRPVSEIVARPDATTTTGDRLLGLLSEVARTLLKNPPILILDEATSALDSRTEAEIQSTLEAIEQGRTTLIIAHRLSTVVHADRIVVLEAGRVAEQGTHADLLRRGGIYAEMWARQAREREEALAAE